MVNGLWFLICLYAFTMETANDFYIGAVMVGLVMGGIQATSRATYAKFLPETTDTASFFSFYDVSEKIGIIIGLIVFGFLTELAHTMRYAPLFFAVVFVIGALLLTRVPKKIPSVN